MGCQPRHAHPVETDHAHVLRHPQTQVRAGLDDAGGQDVALGHHCRRAPVRGHVQHPPTRLAAPFGGVAAALPDQARHQHVVHAVEPVDGVREATTRPPPRRQRALGAVEAPLERHHRHVAVTEPDQVTDRLRRAGPVVHPHHGGSGDVGALDGDHGHAAPGQHGQRRVAREPAGGEHGCVHRGGAVLLGRRRAEIARHRQEQDRQARAGQLVHQPVEERDHVRVPEGVAEPLAHHDPHHPAAPTAQRDRRGVGPGVAEGRGGGEHPFTRGGRDRPGSGEGQGRRGRGDPGRGRDVAEGRPARGPSCGSAACHVRPPRSDARCRRQVPVGWSTRQPAVPS